MLVSAVIVLVGRQSWEVLPLALLGIAVATRKLLRRATPPSQNGTMT
jgi:hypothetical protein